VACVGAAVGAGDGVVVGASEGDGVPAAPAVGTRVGPLVTGIGSVVVTRSIPMPNALLNPPRTM
jgi:hypothetical protein